MGGIAPLDYLAADGLDAAITNFVLERAAKAQRERQREQMRWLAENVGVAVGNAVARIMAAMR